MSTIKLPSVSKGMSTDALADIVAKLIKEIQWLSENIDTDNVREIGGWNVGQDSLSSISGNVGFSSAVTGGDDIRMWSGSSSPSIAPFRVYNSGKLSTSNIEITGGTMTIGSKFGLTSDGTLTVNNANISGNITMTGGSISWANINSDPVAIGAASNATSALNISNAIANGTYSGGTFISGTQIYSPTITGGTIQTQAAGNYPRTVMSVSGNLLGAYKNASSYVVITPEWTTGGAPGVTFSSSGVSAAIFPTGIGLGINAGSGLIGISAGTMSITADNFTFNTETVATRQWVQTNAVAKFA